MVDAVADGDEVSARGRGGNQVGFAVADINRALGTHLRASEAQFHDIGRGLRFHFIAGAGDRIEYAVETEVIDNCGNGRGTVGGEPDAVARLI